MLNKKRKGFTIVELVIVIAVIAILAAVLIPTFAGIIDKANESADKQAVRQMNIALAAESIENEPDDVGDVIDILAEAGFNSTDKLVPVSAGHGFYWCKAANMITLIRDEGEGFPELIFPTEEATLNTAFTAAATNWTVAITGDDAAFVDLEPAGINKGLPTGGGNGGGNGGVTTVDGFKKALTAALETGGTVTLGGPIEITEAISIPSGAKATIDLGGHTLELNDPSNETNGASHAIDVQGTLNIVNNANTGTVILNQENTAYDMGQCGINVEGTLNLNGVNVTCNRRCNIENYGTTNLTNSKFTVKNSIGLYSRGGDTVISGGEFVASGSGVTPILSEGYYSGTMEISGTTFTEENSATYSQAVIVWGSTEGLVLTDVKMATTQANVAAYSSCVTIKGGSFGGSLTGLPLVIQANDGGEYGTFAGLVTLSGSGNSISGGTFSGKLTFGQDSETTITDGTFTGGFYGAQATVTIDGGTFIADSENGIELEVFHRSNVTINGGTFTGQLKCTQGTHNNNYPYSVTIKRGTIFNGTAIESIDDKNTIYTSEDCSLSASGDCWIITGPH